MPRRAIRATIAVPVALLSGALAAACDDRERVTFPEPNDGAGPVTTIDRPGVADTTIRSGPGFFVNGTSVDEDGVDTVYFLLSGGNEGFSPFVADGDPEVRFALPISTGGLSGRTVRIEVYGVDQQGNRGLSSVRHLQVE